MNAAHHVTYHDEAHGNLYALITSTNDDGTKELLVWYEAEDGGWQRKHSVAHGSDAGECS
jgi:hypothetical protein